MSKTETEIETEPDQISQEDLESYRELSSRSRELNWTVEKLRKSLLSRIDAGVPVEKGALDAVITESEQKRMTNDELVRILGIEVVENVRAAIKPQTSRSLKIVERAVKSAAARSRRRKVA